jgi:ApaG protein
MNSATTGGITVSVETAYIEKDSDPDNQYFVWAYRIKIKNNSVDTVQLVSRHWMITDAQGRQQEVRGAGVVGEQPVLAPGASFS